MRSTANEEMATRDYLNPPHGSIAYKRKERLQNFYIQLLPEILRKLQISAVLSYHIRLPADVDLGIASQKINVPYLVLYREGMFASAPGIRNTMRTLFGRFGFGALHCLFTMKAAGSFALKQALETKQTFSLGAMRMGLIFKASPDVRNQQKRHNRVCLFPFTVKDVGKFDMNLFPFLKSSSHCLARIRKRKPAH